MPTRSCIACRKRESWKELLHLVVIDGQVLPDPDHKLPGRGAWLHLGCFEMAKNRRAFVRAFPKASKALNNQELGLDVLASYVLNS